MVRKSRIRSTYINQTSTQQNYVLRSCVCTDPTRKKDGADGTDGTDTMDRGTYVRSVRGRMYESHLLPGMFCEPGLVTLSGPQAHFGGQFT